MAKSWRGWVYEGAEFDVVMVEVDPLDVAQMGVAEETAKIVLHIEHHPQHAMVQSVVRLLVKDFNLDLNLYGHGALF